MVNGFALRNPWLSECPWADFSLSNYPAISAVQKDFYGRI